MDKARAKTKQQLIEENKDLRARLAEAELVFCYAANLGWGE